MAGALVGVDALDDAHRVVEVARPCRRSAPGESFSPRTDASGPEAAPSSTIRIFGLRSAIAASPARSATTRADWPVTADGACRPAHQALQLRPSAPRRAEPRRGPERCQHALVGTGAASTWFSEEQLVALSKVLERSARSAAASTSALSSTMPATLPRHAERRRAAGVGSTRTLACEPVATTRSHWPHQLGGREARDRRGSVCTRSRGAGMRSNCGVDEADQPLGRARTPQARARRSLRCAPSAR